MIASTIRQIPLVLLFVIVPLFVLTAGAHSCFAQQDVVVAATALTGMLDWQPLPNLPDELGVAGPFVGVHNGALIVAGGANFPRPVWESSKQWQDSIYVLTGTEAGDKWIHAGKLARPVGYGAAVSTDEGVVCIGGNDSSSTFREVFLLRWDAKSQTITQADYPPLPMPCAYGQAVVIDHVIYVAGGQSDAGLDSAMNNFWALKLSPEKASAVRPLEWQSLPAWPGVSRAFNIVASEHNATDHCIYVISGRRQNGAEVEFLKDVWEFTPRTASWRQRSDAPRPVQAGTGIGFGRGRVFVLGGDDGSRFHLTDLLKDTHPGFLKEALLYQSQTDKWSSAGPTPQNQVTTIPVLWNGRMIIATGEVRPRVRTPSVWSVMPR